MPPFDEEGRKEGEETKEDFNYPQAFRKNLVNEPHQDWDVIILGTGMGGATLGFGLARAGKKVLFIEKGKSHLGTALSGRFAEEFFPNPEVPKPEHRDLLMKAGRSPDPITDLSSGKPRSFIPFVGSGTGGSTALYGAALERFQPSDFSSWPIAYDALRPYYEAAEKLYGVRTDYALSPAGEEFSERLTQKGLHPYKLPLAHEHDPHCQGCQGFICPTHSKNDSAKTCLFPAIRDYGASLIDECEGLSLHADKTKVTGIECVRRGQALTLAAPLVVLACGALETPRLLLGSVSSDWPTGLANASGLVGKNLMRHFVDLWAVFPHTKQGPVSAKELAFNDLYHGKDGNYGTVQSFGAMPPVPVMLASMEEDVKDGQLPWILPVFKILKPFLRKILENTFSRTVVFASLMEDTPHEENRISVRGGEGDRPCLAFHYQISAYDKKRIKRFRKRIKEIFKPYPFILIKQAESNERLAHASGTCRMGEDPDTSVVDANNKAHGLENLYVVDSSFFPSSGGTNPGLTIAANALRVAGHLLKPKTQENIRAYPDQKIYSSEAKNE